MKKVIGKYFVSISSFWEFWESVTQFTDCIHKSINKNLVSEVPFRAPKYACQTKIPKLELPFSADK